MYLEKIFAFEIFLDYLINFIQKMCNEEVLEKHFWEQFLGHLYIVQMIPKHVWMQHCKVCLKLW